MLIANNHERVLHQDRFTYFFCHIETIIIGFFSIGLTDHFKARFVIVVHHRHLAGHGSKIIYPMLRKMIIYIIIDRTIVVPACGLDKCLINEGLIFDGFIERFSVFPAMILEPDETEKSILWIMITSEMIDM